MRNVEIPGAKTLVGESVREGCLNETNNGEYVLADRRTGSLMRVTGNPDLALHAGNHAVRLIGMVGNEGMRAIRIDHLAVSCKAPIAK